MNFGKTLLVGALLSAVAFAGQALAQADYPHRRHVPYIIIPQAPHHFMPPAMRPQPRWALI